MNAFQIWVGKGSHTAGADLNYQDYTICCHLYQNNTPHPSSGHVSSNLGPPLEQLPDL